MNSQTIPGFFYDRVREFGNKVALRKKQKGVWSDITWQEYGEKARQVCLGLVSLGLNKGDCVSIISENCPEWLFADQGIMAASGISVGIYTTNPAEQCLYILSHSRSRFYIAENEEQLDKALKVRQKLPHLEKIIVIDMEGLRNFKDSMVISFDQLLDMGRRYGDQNPGLYQRLINDLNPEDTAILVYTSGTTGPPKGVMLSHQGIIWTSKAVAEVEMQYPTDELISYLPLCHIAERLITEFHQLTFGFVVDFVENVDTFAQNLWEVSPSVFFSVPRIWEKFHSQVILNMKEATWFKKKCFELAVKVGDRFIEAKFSRKSIGIISRILYFLAYLAVFHPLRKRLGLDKVRYPQSGAAPISADVLRFFHLLGLSIREAYGLTECNGPATLHRPDDIKLGTVGQPLPELKMKIAPDGEIMFKGPSVFQGYFRDPQATQEAITDGWLYTGDVGKIDEDGHLIITDRKKDLIITAGGKNIAPQNIENQLKFSPYINDAVVIGDGRKYLTALILIDEDNVGKYAQKIRIPYSTYSDLSQNPQIYKLISKEVDAVNRSIARVENIRKFRILDKRLEQEDGEVTPTLKVKRKVISEMYREQIDGMY